MSAWLDFPVRLAIFLLLAARLSDAAVIQRVFGANSSEISHASAGGGTHVYLAGSGIGSAFAPPTVYVGIGADAECVVQPFTSTRNRQCALKHAAHPSSN